MSKAKTFKAVESVRNTVRRWDSISAPSSNALTASSLIFKHEARFSWSAPILSAVPAPSVPEIAFLGCSNAGKSTLLNVLLGRKRNKLVRTSSKPGHTAALNGFSVGRELCLVDTPGYGYRSRDEWGTLIMEFLRTRKSLRRTCLLVDAEHGYKSSDEQLMNGLVRGGVSFQVVLTKVDKVPAVDFEKLLVYSEEYLRKIGKAAIWGEVIGVSSDERRLGLPALRASLCLTSGLVSEAQVRDKKQKSFKALENLKVNKEQSKPVQERHATSG